MLLNPKALFGAFSGPGPLGPSADGGRRRDRKQSLATESACEKSQNVFFFPGMQRTAQKPSTPRFGTGNIPPSHGTPHFTQTCTSLKTVTSLNKESRLLNFHFA